MAANLPPQAAGMVRLPRPPDAVARHARPVCRLAQRDHAPADPGGNRQAVLPALSSRLAYDRGLGPGRGTTGPKTLGRTRLLPPRTATPPGGPADRRRARRPLSHGSPVGRTAAGHRPLHGGRHPLHRLRSAAADPGGQYAAGLQPAAGLRRPNHVIGRPEVVVGGSRGRAARTRRGPLQPGPDGTRQRNLPQPRRPAIPVLPQGCVMPSAWGCNTRSRAPSRGQSSKRFPRRLCLSAVDHGYMAPPACS